jgi:hypothetical protein
VFGGCKVCGGRMLPNFSPLIKRTCDGQLEQKRARHRITAARRKAERHEAKDALKLKPPRCWHCGTIMQGDAARRLRPGAPVLRQPVPAGGVSGEFLSRCERRSAWGSRSTGFETARRGRRPGCGCPYLNACETHELRWSRSGP